MRPTPMAVPALLPALLLAASSALAQGMYSQPYAIVEQGVKSPTRNEDRVAITKVDGKSTRDPRRTDPIPPGKHILTLHYETGRAEFRPEFQEVEIDFEPCTLYTVVAWYEFRTGGTWKPKFSQAPIPECQRKFGKKK